MIRPKFCLAIFKFSRICSRLLLRCNMCQLQSAVLELGAWGGAWS